MSVSCECCVLSGKGLNDGPITLFRRSSAERDVSECDLEFQQANGRRNTPLGSATKCNSPTRTSLMAPHSVSRLLSAVTNHRANICIRTYKSQMSKSIGSMTEIEPAHCTLCDPDGRSEYID
jgi:hypothetical protein